MPKKPDLKPLSTDFYVRDTVQVARELLGKVLIVRPGGRGPARVARIVETEAYRGDDPASHASRGLTPRCAPMFETGGIAYVYFIYGMYPMLNFVTERAGYPGAVLIRAVEPLAGNIVGGTHGPGRLTRALGIEMRHNRAPLHGPELVVAADRAPPSARGFQVLASPRVGIRLGRDRPWRFFIDGNPCVSRVKENDAGEPLYS